MYTKGIFSLPSIAAIAAATLVIRWFVFRKREIRSDPPAADANHTEASDLASSSADSVAASGVYEVFLSFCGRDTRLGFTDFLYTYLVGAGIRTFRDDNELRVGKEIGPELFKSIKESKISVPIFSKNYAASKWCLLELEEMVCSHENGGQMIYPVFYDVDPSDVRNQTGSYKKGFRQHEKSFGEETVQRWRNALNMVGKMKGLELKKETHGRQGELVKIIVEEILSKLQKNYTHVPDNLVGFHNHIEKMMELLKVDTKGLRIVGIHGMGGLGKTTIAKVIYNQLCERFEGYCFLENVRENCERHNGTIDLQKQLIKNILKCRVEESFSDYDQGRSRIKNVVSGKKLLIVLDDVDNIFQVDKLMGHQSWFGPQTRIILTTRDKAVLDEIELNCQSEVPPDVYGSYNPDFLNHCDSLQLFCKYAFKRDLPVEGYDKLAKEVVYIAAGLPLVLVVLGSTFFPVKDKDIWEQMLTQLRKIPNRKVMETLKFSFEALEHHEKQIFLDIACLFIGHDKTSASYMWEDCGFCPILGIRSLISRSLIKIGYDNKFIMHDQLRDLGRRIVCEESLNNLEKQTRLWRREDAMQILDGCQNLLPNLRWLKCDCFGKFSPINLNMKNLVVLHLSSTSTTHLTEDWEGWKQLKMANKLKFLDLSSCINIRVLPDLSFFASLEILNLDSCRSLCRLDGLQLLKSLVLLNLSGCSSIEALPDLSNLQKLTKLNVSGCVKLTEIHGLEKLESLVSLNLSGCSSIEALPDLSNLQKLTDLNVYGCVKLTEIHGLEKLESLESLYFYECSSIEALPDLSNLHKLTMLDVYGCVKLTEIHGLEKLESLESLNLSGCSSIEVLPDLSNLQKLPKLDVYGCVKLTEIHGLEKLESLESLNLSGCSSIEVLPDLSNLQKLTKLDVYGCVKLTEIHGLEKLESLVLLNLSGCSSIEALPDLSNLQKLSYLNVSGCVKLTEIHGLEKLESLESLNLIGCSSIEALPDLSNLQKLTMLDVYGCVKLTEIHGLEKLESLVSLYFYECSSIEALPDLSNLQKLTMLGVYGYVKLTEIHGLEKLESLVLLNLSGCSSIEALPDLSNLQKLRFLNVSGCVKLTEIHGLEKLESLDFLDLSECSSIEALPDLSNLQKLARLAVYGCVKLTEIHGLEKLESLVSLNLSKCNSIEALPDLSNLQKLRYLNVSGCVKLTEICGLETLKSLNSYVDYKGNWVNPQI